MASISKEPGGRRTIQFVAGDGRRRSIRLGKVTQRLAEEIKGHIEALNAAVIAHVAIDRRTAEWLGDLDPKLYDKLANVDLTPKRAQLERATLGLFLDGYLKSRTDAKPLTITSLRRTRDDLVNHFGATKPLADITAGDADEFRRQLESRKKRPLADNTVRRRCSIARQFFRAAVKHRLIRENPFGEMKGISVRENKERSYFISRADAEKVIAACPDAQWRLLFALSRWGGLRCPSEHLGLRWGDVDWDPKIGRLHVTSPKTEHHQGGGSRAVPLFPELRPHLEEVYREAQEAVGLDAVPSADQPIITRYRDTNSNLRTQLNRIIRRAGLTPWPKLFQNLRSTRQTELVETQPLHRVCAWLGNSEIVATKHYLQVTDAHFEEANSALHNPVQSAAEPARTDSQPKSQTPIFSEESELAQVGATEKVGPPGLEPGTKGL